MKRLMYALVVAGIFGSLVMTIACKFEKEEPAMMEEAAPPAAAEPMEAAPAEAAPAEMEE